MNRILLDTNILLWMFFNHPRYDKRLEQIFNEADEVYYSVISIWEIAIKQSSKGYRDLDIPSDWYDLLIKQTELNQIDCLDVEVKHCKRIEHLPPRHRDPFDRMLIAQAMEHNLAVMTSDKIFMEYDIEVLN